MPLEMALDYIDVALATHIYAQCTVLVMLSQAEASNQNSDMQLPYVYKNVTCINFTYKLIYSMHKCTVQSVC